MTDQAMTPVPGMPDAGERRYWFGKHQPNKKATPLRLELRERTNHTDRIVATFSRLIGFEDVAAQPAAIVEAGEKIIERAARVDEFTGVLGGKDGA